MKKTYIIPTLKTYKARMSKMVATSPLGYGQGGCDGGTGYSTEGGYSNSNSLDDQSGPWYRR